jgi:hypothetical protein
MSTLMILSRRDIRPAKSQHGESVDLSRSKYLKRCCLTTSDNLQIYCLPPLSFEATKSLFVVSMTCVTAHTAALKSEVKKKKKKTASNMMKKKEASKKKIYY